jgi:DNA primase
MNEPREDYDKEEIRRLLKFPEVLAREYPVELRRAGTGLQCRCHFHEERTASFSIRGGEHGDTGHCFGCG